MEFSNLCIDTLEESSPSMRYNITSQEIRSEIQPHLDFYRQECSVLKGFGKLQEKKIVVLTPKHLSNDKESCV